LMSRYALDSTFVKATELKKIFNGKVNKRAT